MSDAVFTLHRGTTPLLVSVPHVGTAIPDDTAAAAGRRARSPSRTPTGISTALYAFARELGASLLVPRHSRYVVDLNRPPENTPMYPGAQQHRAVPDALLQRRAALPRRPGARRRRDRRGVAPPTGSPTTTRCAPSSRGCKAAHGHAMLFDGHSIQSELPWLFEGRLPDLNLGTAGGASCAPGAARRARRRCWRAQRGYTPRRRRPLQGRLHHAPLRPAAPKASTRCSSRCAGAATWPRSRRTASTPARGDRLLPVLRDLLQATLDWKADAVSQRCSGRRAPGSPAAGASACCCAPAPTAAGPRSRPTSPRRRRRAGAGRPGAAGPGRCAQPRLPARLRRPRRTPRRGDTTTSGRGATACTASRCASRPRSCARSRRSSTSSCSRGGYTQVCEFHYLQHDADGSPTPTRWRCRGRSPTRPPRPASA